MTSEEAKVCSGGMALRSEVGDNRGYGQKARFCQTVESFEYAHSSCKPWEPMQGLSRHIS